MSTISEALAVYANALRAQDERRASTVGASEIGQCARKTFYLKRGDAERDPEYFDSWGAALRGSVIERAFLAAGATRPVRQQAEVCR